MRIGIDAKWFFNGNPSGRVVVKNLLEKLIELNTDNEIYVILNKKDIKEPFPFQKNKIKLIYVWGGVNLLSNIIIVPFVLLRYKLDVCVFQYFAPLFGKYKKIVFIHDIIFKTNPEYFTLKERIYFSPMKFLAKHSDGIVTVSESEKKRIIKHKFLGNKTRIQVVHNGVDKKFKPKEYLNPKDLEQLKVKYNLPERFLLYVGRLNERKNILNLLKAVRILNDKEIKLVLCGNYDWKMFNLPQMINELDLGKRVTLLGYVNDEELPLLYSLASIFCYVSYEEGFGLPPLEAMASGIPVVVSNINSLIEVCGDTGYYCNPNDPKDIAEIIDMVLTNKELRELKIRNGLERSKNFNWENSTKTLLQFFEQVIES